MSANEFPALAPEIEAILDQHNVDDLTREIARKYHKDWGKASPHLNSHPIETWQQLFIHARCEEEARITNARLEEREGRNARRRQRAAQKQSGPAWLAWQEQCTQRNAWIEQANAEWRRRVDAMNKAMAQWKAYVQEARSEYQQRKATPPPVQPAKQ